MAKLIRTCIGCKQTDDHPRHDEIIQIDPELVEVSWHLDCHAIATGCPTCTEQTRGADGKTGDAMRKHILAQAKKG